MSAKPHECRPPSGCCCSIAALEPNEDCPVHGWPDDRRCEVCGRFMKRRPPQAVPEPQPSPPAGW